MISRFVVKLIFSDCHKSEILIMSLKGKICIVTAAGQGIGRATAELFHKNGGIVHARY